MAVGPLSGIRVLEFTQIIAGPFACQNLADMGAEVIKVEPPEGEAWRVFNQFIPGEGKYFQSLNRGKYSLVLNLQHPEAQEIVHKLIPEIDVVIINYRPDVPKKLNIDYETLQHFRKDLIYVDNTAFGRKGPNSDKPGYDIIAQALSGLMVNEGKYDAVTGTPKNIASPPIADYGTGIAIAWGVCAALYHREKTGEGQLIESNLLQTALAFQGSHVMDLPAADTLKYERMENVHQLQEKGASYPELIDAHNPLSQLSEGNIYYRPYSTRDGAIAVGALSSSLWTKVRAALGTNFLGMADPEFNPQDSSWVSSAREEVQKIEEHVQSKTTKEWEKIFTEHGVPNGALNFPEDLINDEQVIQNDGIIHLTHDLSGEQRQVGPLLKMSKTPLGANLASPPLGRDTESILSNAGYSIEQIEKLRTNGTIN